MQTTPIKITVFTWVWSAFKIIKTLAKLQAGIAILPFKKDGYNRKLKVCYSLDLSSYSTFYQHVTALLRNANCKPSGIGFVSILYPEC